ncbi:MAG: hypothetical protein KGO51_11180 [Alphaproteobacteria bacterium]|nr:hypothetical protein [Alphaproteobacteria bacterium]
MTKMKMMAAVAASTIALGGATVATTAQAQPWRYEHAYNRDNRLMTPYVDGLAWKIDNAARQGRISWPQARQLHAQLRSVQPLAYRYQTGQARPWEVNRLERVVDHIDNLTRGYAYNGYRRWR